MSKLGWGILIFVLFSAVFVGIYQAGFFDDSPRKPNYEAVARVKSVKDGDTLGVRILKVLDLHRGISEGDDEVRFAGIDTEELKQKEAVSKHEDVEGISQSEYSRTSYYEYALRAKKILKSLAGEGTKIYLDIDDLVEGHGPFYKSYRGNYGRMVAVAYVNRDGDWINLNSRVLRKVYPEGAQVTTYKSEFDAYSWLSDNYRFG